MAGAVSSSAPASTATHVYTPSSSHDTEARLSCEDTSPSALLVTLTYNERTEMKSLFRN